MTNSGTAGNNTMDLGAPEPRDSGLMTSGRLPDWHTYSNAGPEALELEVGELAQGIARLQQQDAAGDGLAASAQEERLLKVCFPDPPHAISNRQPLGGVISRSLCSNCAFELQLMGLVFAMASEAQRFTLCAVNW